MHATKNNRYISPSVVEVFSFLFLFGNLIIIPLQRGFTATSQTQGFPLEILSLAFEAGEKALLRFRNEKSASRLRVKSSHVRHLLSPLNI